MICSPATTTKINKHMLIQKNTKVCLSTCKTKFIWHQGISNADAGWDGTKPMFLTWLHLRKGHKSPLGPPIASSTHLSLFWSRTQPI